MFALSNLVLRLSQTWGYARDQFQREGRIPCARKVSPGFWLACLGPAAAQSPPHSGVRFSEIHYDNVGTDGGEAIEICGSRRHRSRRAGAWCSTTAPTVCLSTTTSLSGTIPAICGTRGVVVISYPRQRHPERFAGWHGAGRCQRDGGRIPVVRRHLCGRGDGPASGLPSVDIGRFENGQDTSGRSLARAPNGSWNASAPNSFGVCNDQDPTPPAEVVSVSVAPASVTLECRRDADPGRHGPGCRRPTGRGCSVHLGQLGACSGHRQRCRTS